ncbi:MAG: hypothetical protein MUC96_32825 [Myxococcaceae bacterium]|nr:hypothetical protein [Myxococcaceae bacterium]
MKRFTVLLATAVAALLSGCGGNTCDRIDAAQKRFFGSSNQCSYTSGSSTVTVRTNQASLSSCNAALAKCTTADLQVLDGYTKCIEAAPACTAGNEKAAADAFTACIGQLITVSGTSITSKLSTECGAGFQ